MKWTSWLAIALVAVLTLIVAVVGLFGTSDSGMVSQDPRVVAIGPTGPLVLPEWQLSDGTVLNYDLVDHGSIGTEVATLSGPLKIEVVATTATGYLAWLSFAASANPKAAGGSLGSLVPLLHRGTLITLARRGFVVDLASEAEAKAAALPAPTRGDSGERFWRSVFERLRADWDTAESGAQFRRTQLLGSSQVAIVYTFSGSCARDASAPPVLSQVWSPLPGAAAQSSGRSDITFLSRCQGPSMFVWKGDEVAVSGSAALTAHTELSLTWRGQNQVAVSELRERLQNLVALAAQPTIGVKDGIDKAVIGTLDEGQLLALLRQQGGVDEVGQDLYLQLKSWLALHPESIAAIQRALRDVPADDQRVRALIKALTAVGSAEAQEALVGMIKDAAAHPDAQQRLITSLGFVAHPTQGTVDAVLGIADHGADPATTQRARMASGVLGSRLRTSDYSGDQQRAAALEQHIDSWLKEKQSEREVYDSLAALGNLGPKNTGVVREVLEHADSPQIRGQAYFALRFSPDPDVSAYLVKAYETETGNGAPQVRGDIVRSLASRPVDGAWFKAVLDLSSKQGLPSGEIQALGQAIGRAASVDPGQSNATLDRLILSARDDATKAALQSLRHS